MTETERDLLLEIRTAIERQEARGAVIEQALVVVVRDQHDIALVLAQQQKSLQTMAEHMEVLRNSVEAILLLMPDLKRQATAAPSGNSPVN